MKSAIATFFTKTVLGAVLAGGAMIYANPKDVTTWAQGVGLVVTAYGARRAIAKNGAGK